MPHKKITVALAAVLFTGLIACQPASNTNSTNTNSTAKVSESGPKKTLMAFYQAMSQGNEQDIKQTLTKRSVTASDFIHREMKQTTFNPVLLRIEAQGEGIMGDSGKELEVTGEKIDGDKAVLDLKNPENGQSSQAHFVMENGEWKLELYFNRFEKKP
jgi:hypothetical protein